MRKAVFFDIDGTIWDGKMQIPESTKGALKQLKDEGHYTFLCTGRSRSNTKSPKLSELGFDGIVAGCGTYIEFQGEKVFEYLLSEEQLIHVLNILKKHGMPVVLEGPEYIYVDETEFQDDPYVIYLRKELGDRIKPIQGTKQFRVNKMSAAIQNADVKQCMADLGEEYDVIVHVADAVVEIGKKGFSKATGIAKVCELLDIAKEDTYAFGDSANDIEMLTYVAHGIAMGNATKEAKDVAEYITTPIQEDGIKNGLLYYGLIS